jgi:hypothetical protein
LFIIFWEEKYKKGGDIKHCISLKMESDKKTLENWIEDQVRYGRVPRLNEVRSFAQDNNLGLKLKDVKTILRLHPLYLQNMPQQRQPHRGRKYRPIIVNDLGYWHCDIGFFAINKRYPTPPSYRAGFLVAKDVLSRYIYATPLIKNRTATSMIKAFKILLTEHRSKFKDIPVKSISFDRETSVVGKKVQQFLAEEGISFHDFQMSDSKAKHAESAIRQIRTVIARLLRRNNKKDRWWNLLPIAVESLNSQKVIVGNKSLKMAPKSVDATTLSKFKERLYKAAPSYYWAQYEIDEDMIKDWKFTVGTKVRAKLVAVTSAVIGKKRSEENLTEELFLIEERVPYVTRNMEIGKAYRCRNLDTDRMEVFQEDEIALSK